MISPQTSYQWQIIFIWDSYYMCDMMRIMGVNHMTTSTRKYFS